MKILFADDDPLARLKTRSLLKKWGYEAELASDGAAAWQVLAASSEPVLAIVDWMMPELDGLEIARRLRERKENRPAYLILVTARSEGDDVAKGLEAGADDYVVKPFDPRELRSRMDVGLRTLRLQATLSERVAELGHERHLMKCLMDTVPDLIYFKDRKSHFTRINAAQAASLGLTSPEAAIGKSDFDFLISEAAHAKFADEQAILRSGVALIDKTELAGLPAQPPRWLSTTKAPLYDSEGGIAGTFGVSRDITERKLSEDALRRSEESFRILFTAIPTPVWVFDQETLRFMEVNEAAVRHYGYSREEFLRMKITDIRSAEEAARLTAELERLGAGNGPRSKWKYRTKDGRELTAEIESHAFDFGDRPAVLIVAEDVTEREQAEVELRHTQKLEAVGGLAAGIAHEINTPIQFIGDNTRFLLNAFESLNGMIALYRKLNGMAAKGNVDQALVEEVARSEQAADLDYLTTEIPQAIRQSLEGVERVATIVRAMKEFAHPDQREKVAADLNKAIQNALVVSRNELKYVADVETNLGELPPVLCHVGDINQVFLNILVNAAHAIGDVVKGSGARGKIRVVTRADGECVQVSISDTGGGIPAEIRDKIFEPFFTTKEVGRGTGQGLAIVRSIIVDKHGGTVTFDSEVGRGTTFTIHLPVHGTPDPVEATTN
jgi:two-component system, NtrC family, sensor kinase